VNSQITTATTGLVGRWDWGAFDRRCVENLDLPIAIFRGVELTTWPTLPDRANIGHAKEEEDAPSCLCRGDLPATLVTERVHPRRR